MFNFQSPLSLTLKAARGHNRAPGSWL